MRQRPSAQAKVRGTILFGVYMVGARFILDTNDKEYIIQNRGLWEELIDRLRDDTLTINVRKTDVDELTNFFIKYKF